MDMAVLALAQGARRKRYLRKSWMETPEKRR